MSLWKILLIAGLAKTKKAKMLQKEENIISFKGDRMAVVWYCVKILSTFLVRKRCLFSVEP